MEGSPVLEVVESPIDAEEAIRANEPLPDALPVLPLRETVTFPETLTPLAVGQERSIKLVDDVLGGEPDAGDGRLARPREGGAGPADLYEVGVVGVVARCSKSPTGRFASSSRGRSGSGSAPYVAERALPGRRASPRCPTWSSPAPSSRR